VKHLEEGAGKKSFVPFEERVYLLEVPSGSRARVWVSAVWGHSRKLWSYASIETRQILQPLPSRKVSESRGGCFILWPRCVQEHWTLAPRRKVFPCE